MTRSALPSRLALQEAEDYYARTGVELEGYLSEKSGFLPREPPELALPESHKAWDEVAAELPTLWRDLGVRAAIHDLPELRGTEDALPARYVRRASTILALLCHSYVYSERDPYGEMPPVIGQAWDDVGRRLGKPEPYLTYEDLILSNWHKPDPAAPMIQEHIEFLVPAVQIQTERHFYLTQLESHIRASPVVGAVVRAQEAIARGDDDATAEELLLMIEMLRGLMDDVLLKLDPNPYSPTHVDPVLFGGIVADLAVPIDKRIPGASGTAAPLLHVFDSFLGRKVYDSAIGADAIRLRKWGPRALGRFVEGISAGPGAREIMANGSPGLRGLVQTLTDTYSGPRGWLEAHRLKVYGFIDARARRQRTEPQPQAPGPRQGPHVLERNASRARVRGLSAFDIRSSGDTSLRNRRSCDPGPIEWPRQVMRARRAATSSATGLVWVAPAATAALRSDSGSSTTKSRRPVAPPIASGLNRWRSSAAVEIQNRASATAR